MNLMRQQYKDRERNHHTRRCHRETFQNESKQGTKHVYTK